MALKRTQIFTLPTSFWIGVLFSITLGFSTLQSWATPWTPANETLLRHHLETLTDAGLINIPLSQWPLPWGNLAEQLQWLDGRTLTPAQQNARLYLQEALTQAQQPIQLNHQSYLAARSPALTSFSQAYTPANSHSLGLQYSGHALMANVQMQYAQDWQNNTNSHIQWDNSYIAALWGNWLLGAGAINRWWGPSWQDSLILSTNARPSPGLFLQRNQANASSLPFFKHLGPWQLNTFMNQLEAKRDHPHPQLWGMRASIRPWPSIELGFSRVAQWGGKGRPTDAKTFTNMLIGRDNRGSEGISIDASNEPGNQLAGSDLRWSWQLADTTGASYIQVIGEDESGGLPSRNIGLIGTSITSHWQGVSSRLILEASNTLCGFDNNTPFYNTTYEHAIYQSGYRYHRRSLGASTDNDSEVFSLQGIHELNPNRALTWSYRHGRINFDNSGATPAGNGNLFGSTQQKLRQLNLGYQWNLLDNAQVELGLQHYATPLQFAGDTYRTQAYLILKTTW